MRHIILISGKDSLATAFVQTARHPDLPYEFVNCDVHAEYPETYAWIQRVEAKTGWPIVRIGKSLPALIEQYGGFLPSPRQRYCTRETKIEPMEEYLGKDAATVYYGLRADEVRTGYVPLGKSNIIPAYPLQEMGIDLRGVYSIVDAQGLMPPDFFYQRLYDLVCGLLSGVPGWQDKLTRSERHALFAGRSRPNCFFCFFQADYEWVWLFETHFPFFAQGERMEKAGYTFRRGRRLSEFRHEAIRDQVLLERARKVAAIIAKKVHLRMFEFEDSEIAQTSCGLLCGK